jgi:pyrroloquinoline-quinone synthase
VTHLGRGLSVPGSTQRLEQLPPLGREAFEARLRNMGRYYHTHHEFQRRMDAGQLERPAIVGWVANRFYYQLMIPVKDANVLANCPHPEVRRKWLQRILDHDGADPDDPESGGIEAWLRLGQAVGLSRDELLDQRHVLPGVRFAVDAYVQFARNAPWQEAATSSLTELFAPTAHRRRLDSWPTHYPWIEKRGYDYFRKRLSEARRDVEHGLGITLDHCTTRASQERALQILGFKLDVLWTMLDAMWLAYVEGRPPYHGIEPEPP